MDCLIMSINMWILADVTGEGLGGPMLFLVCANLSLILLGVFRVRLMLSASIDECQQTCENFNEELEEIRVAYSLLVHRLDRVERNSTRYAGGVSLGRPLEAPASPSAGAAIDPLLNDYIDRTERLMEICAVSADSVIGSDLVRHTINREIAMLSGHDMWDTIIDAVNNAKGSVIDRLDRVLPGLKTEDRMVYALNVCGVSSRLASVFLGVTVKGYYSRRSRLLKRIKDAPGSDDKIYVLGHVAKTR